MPHFAKLDENNIVVAVLVGADSDEGKEEELTAKTGSVYKQTSYNTLANKHALGGTPFRKNYAGIGYRYDEELDAFIPPKPFESWNLNTETCIWEAPVPRPEDSENLYSWNEETQSWDQID